MTDYVLNQSICNNVDFLTQALRNDKDLLLNGIKSFRGQLADGIKTPCKKWLNTQEYEAGEIVSFGQVLYICKVAHVNKNPISQRYYWQVYKLPYTQNEGKVKAYVMFKTDLTILDSYNVTNIVEYTNMRYLINFTTNLGSNANALTSLMETGIDNEYLISTYGLSSSSLNIQCFSGDDTYLYNLTDNNNIYICIIVYSTANILH